MSNKDVKRVVAVLGMHRGGTSAVARSLQVLGVGLGDNLYPPAGDNPTGFWEDRDCIAINEALLSHVGTEYDQLGLAWSFNVDDPSINHLFSKAIKLVSESVLRNNGVWGVKDPRICRLLDFWRKVFEACGCDVSYVISLRDPLSVAKSLQHRNRIPLEKSVLLWLQHMVPAVLGSHAGARVVVNYDFLLDAPEKQVARMANYLKMPLDVRNNASLAEFSQKFLDDKLRHGKYSLSQISSNSQLPHDVIKAYELLLRVAKDEISIDSDEVQRGFEHIQSNMQVYTPVFEQVNVLELEIERLSLHAGGEQSASLIQAPTVGKVQLMITLAERDAQVASLNQTVEKLSAELVERNAQIAGQSEMTQALVSQVAEKEQVVQAFSAQAVKMDATIQALNAQVAEKEQVVQAFSAQAVKMDEIIRVLNAQLAEKEQALQALSAQAVDEEQSIKTLTAQVEESNRTIQTLNARMEAIQTAAQAPLAEKDPQLPEIVNSKAWKLAMIFRRIRVFIVPPNSRRASLLRQLMNIFSHPIKKVEIDQKYREDLPLIKSSGLFDATWYLSNYSDVAQSKMDPLFHYLLVGWLEGRDPGPNFSSVWYLNTNEDVKMAGMNPLVHYLRYGKSEGRAIHSVREQEDLVLANSPDVSFDRDWYMKNNPDVVEAGMDPYEHYKQHGIFEGRLGRQPDIDIRTGGIRFDPSKDTVLVVSHEASRTGAPILSLNIVQRLQKKYNVIALLLGDGSITEEFREASTFVVGPVPAAWNPALAAYTVGQVLKLYKIKFAIVNSIVSYAVLPVLANFFVPTISLIHEFSIYARPKGVVVGAALWSTEMVFSTSVIHENAVFDNPVLENHPFLILPQGRCTPSFVENDIASLAQEEARVLKVLRPEELPSDTFLVLGVGMVQIRKGVDLFIDCAARVMRSAHGRNFRFVWIGTGYNPEVDLNYSMYLADQVHRAGLQEHLFFMEETSNIDAAYDAADVLLISSRLDPLPNIGIDAMLRGLPLVCFEKTTGIADILIANGLGEECVAPYLDTATMADQVMAFAASKSFSQRVGEQLRQAASKEFDMENYVLQLEKIGLASGDCMIQEQADVLEISAAGLARLDFFLPQHLKNMSPDEAIRYYVRTWASGIERRKLFPGFHPGIFLEQHGLSESGCDPLANYLRAGRPAGPWCYDVITSDETAQPLPPDARVALHLHVYYPDLLPEMLKRLNGNQVKPDLFVSVPTELVRDEVDLILKDYSGKLVEIQIVPNRGRDIGPFLTAFGATFMERYDVIGHLHTKKTAAFKDESIGKDWHTFLMENLLGGRSNMADIIIGRLVGDPSIGMIFPDDPNAEPYVVGWGRNKPYAESLAPQLGLGNLPDNLLFPVGTMFWANVEALKPIFNLGMDWQDYPTEPLPYDGSILHALERLLPLVASGQGFRSVLTNVAGITR